MKKIVKNHEQCASVKEKVSNQTAQLKPLGFEYVCINKLISSRNAFLEGCTADCVKRCSGHGSNVDITLMRKLQIIVVNLQGQYFLIFAKTYLVSEANIEILRALCIFRQRTFQFTNANFFRNRRISEGQKNPRFDDQDS